MKLAFGPWEMVVAPDAGAAILSLTRNGTDILRPTPEGATDPFDRACFPLVPYANRIAFGTFEWEGRMHHIPHNHPGQTHPLHGTGWHERWAVEDQDDARLVCQLTNFWEEIVGGHLAPGNLHLDYPDLMLVQNRLKRGEIIVSER